MERVDRFVDIAVVVIISIATVFTAWCSFEAGHWSGIENHYYQQANESWALATGDRGKADTQRVMDVTLFIDYLKAYRVHDTVLSSFFYSHFRPEAQRAADAWLAQDPLTNPKAPTSPFAMRSYHLATEAQAAQEDAAGNADVKAALHAHERADRNLLITVIMASVSFLAGVSGKLRYPYHFSLVILSSVMLIVGAVGAFFFAFG